MDVSSNPFMLILRSNFEKLLKSAAESRNVILVPKASSLIGVHITQLLIETHILCPTHIPGNYLTLRGLGVEVHGSRVSTSFGFKELRTCQILREESFYESGSQFKVLLVDRPLQGIYTGGGNKETDGSESVVRRECMSLAEAADFIVNRWLHDGPQVQTAIQRAIDDFQETHIPIPDFETETAVAIGSVAAFVGDCVCRHRNLANSGGASAPPRPPRRPASPPLRRTPTPPTNEPSSTRRRKGTCTGGCTHISGAFACRSHGPTTSLCGRRRCVTGGRCCITPAAAVTPLLLRRRRREAAAGGGTILRVLLLLLLLTEAPPALAGMATISLLLLL
eukprot:GHVU01186317.1.p1 GENE.GHVU01186317.1~~GHVU01186317.1.p1  ORF type:complete len:336 (+),score=56.68 GHVU01186317.1:646-1653(+)